MVDRRIRERAEYSAWLADASDTGRYRSVFLETCKHLLCAHLGPDLLRSGPSRSVTALSRYFWRGPLPAP